SYAPAWTALGAARLGTGDGPKAAEAFERAVAIAPTSVEARLALAQYRWAAGDGAGAENTLKEALATEPHQRVAHRALALLYLTTKRPAEAEPHFKALADRPDGALALADYYVTTNHHDAARQVLLPLRQDKDRAVSVAARLRLAAMDYAAGRKTEAYRTLDALIQDRPRDEQPRLTKARWLLADGDAAQAAREAGIVVKANGESAPAQYIAGVAAFASGNLRDAETAFHQVLNINPRAAAAELQLARVHLAQGDAAGALSASRRAAQLEPQDPMAGILMSRSLRAAGNPSAARDELQSRLKREPG